jgi:nitrogen fixation NifU-like protein
MSDLRELYQEVILDHGKSPRNFGELPEANRSAAGNNPICGDQLTVYLQVDDQGLVRDCRFVGRGCAISMASASMMTESVKGKTVEQAKALFEAFQAMCTGEEDAPVPADADDEAVERLQILSGVRQYPMRVKCATLAWHTMNAAVEGEAEVTSE